MKILVFGSDGFIGKNVRTELEKNSNNTIYGAVRLNPKNNPFDVVVDLLNPSEINEVFKKIQPETVVNCAGVVDVKDDVTLNSKFSSNIIEQAKQFDCIKKIIISGSAGEYGKINENDLPVNENQPLMAESGYGYSKLIEEKNAFELSEGSKIKIVCLRIFNPIGRGMAPRFLLPAILRQIDDVTSGSKKEIELFRVDSGRDYISVKDIATALRVVAEGNPKYNVYNVGSGICTTNGELVSALIDARNVDIKKIDIKEMSATPEPLVACQADISRIKNEFNWNPKYTLRDTVKEIVDEEE